MSSFESWFFVKFLIISYAVFPSRGHIFRKTEFAKVLYIFFNVWPKTKAVLGPWLRASRQPGSRNFHVSILISKLVDNFRKKSGVFSGQVFQYSPKSTPNICTPKVTIEYYEKTKRIGIKCEKLYFCCDLYQKSIVKSCNCALSLSVSHVCRIIRALDNICESGGHTWIKLQ